jgi:large subunit ribosomal protein L4
MKIDIVNANKETVGAIDLKDEIFGGRVNTSLIWESVTQENAAERRGTHQTKNRSAVSGSGKNPLWRKGGTVFGPMPRSYEYSLPRKVKLGALRAALAAKLADGTLLVVDTLKASDGEKKTKNTAAMFKKLGVKGKTLVIDVKHDEGFALTARNIAGVRLVPSSRVTARDVMDTDHVVTTKEALEKLQESLG